MTGPDWLAGAARVVATDGGDLVGGPPRWVWHTYEADPTKLDAVTGAQSLRAAGNSVHFVFNPLTGDIVQMLPASQSGRGLVNLAGGVQINRMGSACIQIEVIAFASNPWTGYLSAAGKLGVAKLIEFAHAHGIPDAWPAGPPPADPGGSNARSATIWTTQAGHYGHSQVPENDHGDPGALNINVLFAVPAVIQLLSRGGNVFVIQTPSNGLFAVWPNGDHLAYARIDSAQGARWIAGGVPKVSLAAADADALMHLQALAQNPDTVPAVVDVKALAAELAPLLPQAGLTADQIADVLAARLAQ